MDEAKEYSDTAVVVIGRSGGEGADLPTDMKSVIDGSYAKMAEEVSVSPDNYGYVKEATQTMETMMTSMREKAISSFPTQRKICWIQYAPSLIMLL